MEYITKKYYNIPKEEYLYEGISNYRSQYDGYS